MDRRPSSRPGLLAAGGLLALAVLGTSAAAYVAAAEARARGQAQADLLAVADLKARRAGDWLAGKISGAAALRANLLAGEGIAALARGPRTEAQPLLGPWLDALVRAQRHSSAVALDLDGALLARSAAAPRAFPEPARPWLEAARTSGETAFGLSASSEGAGELYVVVPLLDVRRRPAGFLAFHTRIEDSLLPLLDHADGVLDEESLFVRREGDEVVYLVRARGARPLAVLRRPLDTQALPAAQAVRGEEGVLRGVSHAGEPVIAAARAIPGSDWKLVVQREEASVLAQVRVHALLAAGVAALVLLAGGVAALAWSRREAGAWEARERRTRGERDAVREQFTFVTRHVNEVVLVLSPEGAILDANDRAVETYGWPREALLGMTVADLRAPEARADVAGHLARAASPEGVRFETLHRRRDGDFFPVEVSSRATTLDGRVILQSIVRDLTDRKAAEAALRRAAAEAEAARRSEQKFRTAFAESGFGVLAVDPDGIVLEANEAFLAMLGLGEAEVVGRAIADFVHPDERASSREAIARLAGGRERSVRLDRRYVRRDGTVVQTVLRIVAMRDAGGALRQTIGLAEDVTELRRLQAQLHHADRMVSVGTLAAGVAHEINNPLAFMGANLRWAKEELDQPAPDLDGLRTVLREVEEGTERVRDIVRDLRTLSRDDASGPRACDLHAAVRSAASMAQAELKHRAALVLDLAPVPLVAGSPHRVGQVLLNLLVNAAQAIAPGRAGANAVTVRTRDLGGDRVAVEVSDTGVGIPPELRARIFEPFFTTKKLGEGTGLGLSICHGIVAGLGGEISVESTPGQGSTFRVVLPAGVAAESPAPAPPPPRAAPARRVLVVDDEPLVGAALVRVLGREHQVVALTSAAEALERLRAEPFDAVLCDLMMPQMTGMEFHRRLQAERPALAARVVFLTGGAFAPEAERFLAETRNPVVTKPFEPEVVRDALERAMAA